ncbi:MAG: dTMP kinase [Tissierellia bacterium]|nr:dTMP kinase [Tissierellia bacterium]
MNKNRGLFIALEGPDGSGKTTIANEIYNYYKDKIDDIVMTREPGGTSIGESIRKGLLDNENRHMSKKTEALLFAAQRAQNVDEIIRPAIKRDALVICDRFVISSLAYQGYARNLGIKEVYDINKFAIGDCLPDLVIFIDIDPITTLKRKQKVFEFDRIENAGEDFHNLVYEGYQKALQIYDRELYIIDGTKSVLEIKTECINIINSKMEE